MSEQSPTNGVYYPSWRVYKGYPPSSLELEYVNKIYYAFVRLNEDGTLRLLDEFADCNKAVDGEKGCLAALAKLKHQKPGLKTLISVGGGSGSKEFAGVTANARKRATFARSCRHFVDMFQFDGVDIDWEHPTTPETGRNFISMLSALREELPAPKYILTTALPTGEYCLKHIDAKAAAHLLDQLNLMGYDFNGPWTDVSGHQAQLLPPPGPREKVYPSLRNSCQNGINFLVSRGFPAHKIILGIPAYARSFAGARGPGQPFKGSDEIEYCDLPREWIRDCHVDRHAAAASYVDRTDGGKGFVSFDCPETVRIKADYVKNCKLGGLFYWTGVGDLKGSDSLVKAGYEELHR
ncbi:glycoside hydrolase family 18 protein [Hypomontagnella monticulosa]|nr:glycoside hydrolase family 18 protein [Hypomontagnella monticulosa]